MLERSLNAKPPNIFLVSELHFGSIYDFNFNAWMHFECETNKYILVSQTHFGSIWLSWMLECSLKVKPTNIYLFNFFLIHFGSTWLLSCMLEGILIGVKLYHFNILIFQRLIMSHNSFLCLSPLWSNFPFCSNYFLILIFGYLFLARQKRQEVMPFSGRVSPVLMAHFLWTFIFRIFDFYKKVF